MRLPAAALHGTFLQAYALLTKLASKIGWDELLRARSDVFVMEEEYRKAKEAEETKRKSVTIETIKQVQETRRLSALEEAKQTLDSNPTASEPNGSMYRHNQPEDAAPLSNGNPTNTEVSENESQHKPTENGYVPSTAEITTAKDEYEKEQGALEDKNTATMNQTVAVPDQNEVEKQAADDTEAANLDQAQVVPDQNEVDVADDVVDINDSNHVQESDSKATEIKSADTDDNDSNVPSGVVTPSSAHTGEEKELQNTMSKNAKKNQKKKNKKKNKNKKLTVSPGEANGNANLDEVPSPSTPEEDTPVTPSVISPTEGDVTTNGKLDVNSEEFAEIDITSSEPATVEIPRSTENEEATPETLGTGFKEEPPAVESNFEAVNESGQAVPAMDINTNGSVEPSDLQGLKAPIDNSGSGLGIQSSEAVREPAEASKQVGNVGKLGMQHEMAK